MTTKERTIPIHVLIPAAGRGDRFGSVENKLFAPLCGKDVLAWTIRAFAGSQVDTITLIGRPEERERLAQSAGAAGATTYFTAGGASRQESVKNGVESLQAMACGDDDVVLVHDGARPLVSRAVISRCIDSVIEHGSGVAALRVDETVKYAPDALISAGVDRSGLWTMQTPQAFRLGILRAAHAKAAESGFAGTDDSSLVERLDLKGGVRLVEGSRENLKVTRADDLQFAESWLSRMPQLRVGTGYDIHRFAKGRPLWLGGVRIEHDEGLLGHSDADVALHAICDALLGAAGLPDIGHLYPNTDERFAGAPSIDFARDVRRRLEEAGWRASNVDCTIIAERPRIAPHAAAMRAAISEALGVGTDAVSVKATTNEGLGSLGAAEGIACHATATIVGIERMGGSWQAGT